MTSLASRVAARYLGAASVHMGTCPVCQGFYKVRGGRVTAGGQLVGGGLSDHGYSLAQAKFLQGQCFGSRKTPHEESPATAKEYLTLLLKPEDPTNNQLPKGRVRESEIRRLKDWVSRWKPAPLVDTAGSPDVAKEKARERKVAKLLDLYRSKVDATVQKGDILQLKYLYPELLVAVRRASKEMSNEDILKQLDRDGVWRRAGFLNHGVYLDPRKVKNLRGGELNRRWRTSGP